MIKLGYEIELLRETPVAPSWFLIGYGWLPTVKLAKNTRYKAFLIEDSQICIELFPTISCLHHHPGIISFNYPPDPFLIKVFKRIGLRDYDKQNDPLQQITNEMQDIARIMLKVKRMKEGILMNMLESTK